MQTETLIQLLVEQTRQSINQVEKLKNSDLNTLTWRANPTSWNVLECLEHLNLYGDFYLPEIAGNIKKSTTKSEKDFKSGLLGGYFANSMLPKAKLNKMKTFQDKNPLHSQLDKSVIDRFINQQVQLLDLLGESRKVSLNKVRIKTSISGLIRLKLGDTFQFYLNHIARHLQQIEQVLEAQKNGLQNA